MQNVTLQRFEQQINNLNYDDRVFLIQQLVSSLRVEKAGKAMFNTQLQSMAEDHEIQRELALIDNEFTTTNMDGIRAE